MNQTTFIAARSSKRKTLGALCVVMLWAAIPQAIGKESAAPQISNIHPDYLGRHLRHNEKGKDFFHSHHFITGENLDAEGTEFLVWVPKGDRDAAIRSPDFETLAPPELPPGDAKAVKPIDLKEQVAMVNLGMNTVVWVRGGGAVSKPYLFNIAKPFWVSAAKASPGEVLYIYGRGLRRFQDSNPEPLVALRGEAGVFSASPVLDPRSPRHGDANMLHFQIPADLPHGSYTVYCHNGFGGEYGWRSAGEIVIEPPAPPKPVFDARTYGVVGDGLANDLQALRKALAAAAEAGGGIVHLPPGTFRVDETLVVPAGVELIGSGADQSILEGFGFDPETAMAAWWTSTPVAASVVVLDSHTRIEKLGVRGAVAKGIGGYGMVAGANTSGAWPSHIVIKNCRIDAAPGEVETGFQLYRGSIVMAGSEYVSILENDITGSVEMRPHAHRADIINNTIRQGFGVDICSISIKGSHNLVDSNRFVDTPGRLVFYSSLRSYARYNEMHDMGRGGWTNVAEPFLLHGGAGKSMGNPTGATATTLTDAKQSWQENQYARATVLISHGTGMGQYRAVTGNTKDTLSIDQPWAVQPDATSEYSVGGYITETTLFNNQNFSPGMLALWLDCIGTLVEKHRDQNGIGITLWGQDRSSVSETGEGKQLERFHPSWFNMIMDNWLDGSSFEMIPGASANNAWHGVPLFGNIITHNKIRHPHSSRSPNMAHSATVGGLRIHGGIGRSTPGEQPLGSAALATGAQSPGGRIGVSHTLLSGNLISNTPVGVLIEGETDATFLIGNVFHDVEFPLVDVAGQAALKGNIREIIGATGVEVSNIPDAVAERVPDWDGPRALSQPFLSRTAQGAAERTLLEGKLSRRTFSQVGVQDPKAQEKCAENLKSLYGILKKFEAEKGGLPEAGFYPLPGQPAEKNLSGLLGDEAQPFFVKDTTGWMESTHYVWNTNLNGRKIAEIEQPGQAWMLMDMAMAHRWMLNSGKSGHLQQVNVLFADGSVRSVSGEEAGALLKVAE